MLAIDAPDAMQQIAAAFVQPNLSEALERCARVLDAQVERQFQAEQDPMGRAWQPWYWRREGIPNDHPTLQNSRRLRDSFIFNTSDHVEDITADSLRYGSSVEYAAIHDLGATITTGVALFGRAGGYLPAGSTLRIPQRQIAGWADDSIDEASELIAEAVFAFAFGVDDRYGQPVLEAV